MTVLFTVLFGRDFYTGPSVAMAATLQDLVNQQSTLQKQITQKQQEAAAKKQQASAEKAHQQQISSAIQKIGNDINSTQSKINDTQSQIDQTNKDIADMNDAITAKEQEIEKKKEDIYETAVEYNIALDQSSELNAIISSSSLSGALQQDASYGSLADKLVLDSDALEAQQRELVAQKANLLQKEQSLSDQKGQLTAYQNALDSQKQQQAILLDQSKQAEQQFLTQADQANQQAQNLKNLFAQVSDQAAAMRRAASGTKATSNIARGSLPPSSFGLIWPVNGVITTYFGGSTPFQSFHTGLDIAGPVADDIKAAADGTVTLATTMTSFNNGTPCKGNDPWGNPDGSCGYGNYVMIKHDNGLVTLYGHLSQILVVPGQHVSRGDTIGLRGGAYHATGSGWSTGAHLHFEVRDAQGPDDPMKYLPN